MCYEVKWRASNRIHADDLKSVPGFPTIEIYQRLQ